MTWTSDILISSNLACSLSLSSNDGIISIALSSNDRISSFYWIRGSKLCFLTSFSYLNCYFLFLVISHNCFLLVSLRLSWLHVNPSSRHIFSYLWDSEYHVIRAPPYFLHTSHVFLKQDAHGNVVLESVLVFFPRSAFRRRFLM
jgi:hypothetical protein